MVQDTTAHISALIFRFNILREWRDNHCAGKALNFKEIVILELISRYDGITAAGLSKFLDQTQSSTKEVLDPLIDSGLVVKRETKGGRKVPLSLTPSGIQMLENGRLHYGNYIAGKMLSDLSLEETSVVLNAVKIMLRKVNLQFKELSTE